MDIPSRGLSPEYLAYIRRDGWYDRRDPLPVDHQHVTYDYLLNDGRQRMRSKRAMARLRPDGYPRQAVVACKICKTEFGYQQMHPGPKRQLCDACRVGRLAASDPARKG